MPRFDADPAPCGAALRTRPPGEPSPARLAARRQRVTLDVSVDVTLARAIETEIVPRLLAARGTIEAAHEAPFTQAAPHVMEIAALAMRADATSLRRRLAEWRPGMTPEALCLQLLAPAARLLGEMWDDDRCSFTDVTIGVMQLQEALHALTAGGRRDQQQEDNRRHILLAPAPGDPHGFGVAMVGTFFERAGWRVAMAHQRTVGELASLLRDTWFGVLGFAVSTDRHLPALARALPRLRAASRNPALAIMVGGPVFAGCPQLARETLARELGADATAADGAQATRVAENLLSSLQSARPPYR
jgi:methanogenic corrinoid protein MtbC1